MGVVLRSARPEDAGTAVPLIHSSGPAAFGYLFGHAVGYLHRAFVDGAGEFGHRNHMVAVENADVVEPGIQERETLRVPDHRRMAITP